MPTSFLPYLTAHVPGIGGRIKERLEDFRVEELPLYEPCGEGSHIYFRIVKAGVPTPVALERIARYMGVRPGDIGLAGLKDAQAIATQMLSLEHADPARLAAYRDAQVQVVWTGRHGNKLRPGHLAGNRFVVRIRGAGAGQVAAAESVLEVLKRRGVPNYFGPQRFGARGDTADLGRALVRGELTEFLALYLGRSNPADPPDCRAARDAFDAGFLPRAMQLWPRHYANERRALAAWKRTGKAGPAVAAIDKRMRRLYVSASQSRIFNEVLIRRLDSLDEVWEGDLAEKADNGAGFTVTDPAAEQPRCQRFEISPTGPIVGYRGNLAEGQMGEIEHQVLAAGAVSPEDFRRVGALKVKGGRRALRFALGAPALTAGRDEARE
ncbi:MAG: tRNA pseudouridine(13) synthase TruD, partial [Phycisphaerae bacterium]|nr:tRNA pseudouridine(13) synthase TruD [Phycisphaerae bacterium]